MPGRHATSSAVNLAAIARDNADDVATAQPRFDRGDAALGNFVERPRGNLRFHIRERPKQGRDCAQGSDNAASHWSFRAPNAAR